MSKDISLRYLLLGEDRSASSSMKRVGDNAEGAGKRVAGGLSRLSGIVGGEVGEMLERVSRGVESIGEAHRGVGPKLAAIGGVAAGVGIAMQTMASGDIRAQQQLTAAVDATGKGYEGFGEDVERLIEKQTRFGHTDGEVKDALRVLTQAYQDPKKALEQMNLVSDLAAAKHSSLADAASLVARAHGGAGRVFKEFGITVAKTKDAQAALAAAQKGHTTAVGQLEAAQERLADLEERQRGKTKLTVADQQALRHAHEAVAAAQDKVRDSNTTLADAQKASKATTNHYDDALKTLAGRLSGQATAASDTFTGRLAAIKAKVDNAATAIAEKYGPAVTAGGAVLGVFGTVLEIARGKQVANTVATLAGATAEGTATAAKHAGLLATARHTVATIASKTAQLAISAATKAWAAAQWLINAALSANPIGLVIVALAALALGLKYAWDHSATFRDVVTGAFRAIANTGIWLWNNVLSHVVRWIIGGFADVMDWGSKMLEGLSHVPGFGWAKDAADKMHNAASKAHEMADRIKEIPPLKQAAVTLTTYEVHVRAAIVANQGRNVRATLHDMGIAGYAVGTRSARRGLAVVGEQGPELLWMNGGEGVATAAQTAQLLRGGQGGGDTYTVRVDGSGIVDPVKVGLAVQGALRTLQQRGLAVSLA